MTSPRSTHVRFAAIGLNHNHIYGQVETLRSAGGECVAAHSDDPALLAEFTRRFPDVPPARTPDEILDDPSIALIATAAIPSARPGVAIAAMQRGKDVYSDKPGCTTLRQLEDLRRVQKDTGRIYSIGYSEHFGSRASVKAGELVQGGAIGRVVQTTLFGPHRAQPAGRPPWFFEKEHYGGILTDIGSHQVEQFLFFTGSSSAEVASAHVGNFRYPDHPGLEDYGDLTLRGDRGMGSLRCDWYTPDALPVWGDGRLFILGTEGYIEVRKLIDLAGREGGEHLFLVNKQGVQYVETVNTELPFGRQLLTDVRERSETAMPQWRCFLAMQLALEGEQQAVRLTP
ncbi:MAG: Gfo/Idh/MocA family oxidoreductase [Chloroflexi bacterium]|nr:Gfo/Idh/MocA family oxidoreductase [Chloroflexota bacterium]